MPLLAVTLASVSSTLRLRNNYVIGPKWLSFATIIADVKTYILGTPPDHSPSALVPLPEEDDANNNEVSLLEQLQFSYELGLAINLVASEYSANSFRRRGERALLYYKGLQVFVSALHKARNSDPASLKEDKALFK